MKRNTNRISEMLKDNGLSVTAGRQKILQLFFNAPGALSHADIEERAGTHLDRVTIYRTLQSFLNKGIIHNIPSSDNQVKYALCKDDCHEGHHQDRHIHFQCRKCGSTFCIEEVETPHMKLPEGYLLQEVEVVVQGICRQCAGDASEKSRAGGSPK